MQCGDCSNFVSAFGSPMFGLCNKQPKDVGGYERVKITDKADDCSMFAKLERIDTDSRQSTGSPFFRPAEYGYEEKKADTQVNIDKTKDSKQWG